MAIIEIVVAAAAAWIFGAVWYGLIAKRWLAATGMTEADAKATGAGAYAGSFVCALIVAAMTRHVLAASGIESLGGGALAGLGLGLFVVAPYIATNTLYTRRDRALIWMDGAYPAIGMMLMGIVIALI